MHRGARQAPRIRANPLLQRKILLAVPNEFSYTYAFVRDRTFASLKFSAEVREWIVPGKALASPGPYQSTFIKEVK